MLDNLAYDDSDSPAIGLVPPGVPWDEIADHIKIVHAPLIALSDDGGQYVGAYWAGTRIVVTDDLGSGQGSAVDEFRELLRERGED